MENDFKEKINKIFNKRKRMEVYILTVKTEKNGVRMTFEANVWQNA